MTEDYKRIRKNLNKRKNRKYFQVNNLLRMVKMFRIGWAIYKNIKKITIVMMILISIIQMTKVMTKVMTKEMTKVMKKVMKKVMNIKMKTNKIMIKMKNKIVMINQKVKSTNNDLFV